MTISPENFGNGAAKTEDRFTGYRPRSGRDGTPALAGAAHGGSSLTPGSLGGAVLPSDVVDDLSSRNGTSSLDRLTTPLDIGNPIASTLTAPRLNEPGFREPNFGAEAWLEMSTESVVDHPLLRGLLLELPPKGSAMQPEWLDRWFEAARSIFELLYAMEPVKRV
jgi:hypothetical protein